MDIAVEHIPGAFTLSHAQRCVRCGLPFGVISSYARQLVPIYPDYFGELGRFNPYEPVWVLEGIIWPVSPDPEKVTIVFCGSQI